MKSDRYTYPDIGLRVVAKIIDYVFASVVAFALASLPVPPLAALALSFCAFFINVFFADGIPGGSLGKRIMRLSVVNWRRGAQCTYGESFVRNVRFVFMGGLLKIWQELEEESARERGRYTGTVVISLRQDPEAREDDPEREPLKFDLSGVRESPSDVDQDV